MAERIEENVRELALLIADLTDAVAPLVAGIRTNSGRKGAR
jgi:hypothetical protein